MDAHLHTAVLQRDALRRARRLPVMNHPTVGQLESGVGRAQQHGQPGHHLGQQPVGDFDRIPGCRQALTEAAERRRRVVRLAVHQPVHQALEPGVQRNSIRATTAVAIAGAPVVAPSTPATVV